MKVISYNPGDKILDIIFFMINTVTKDGEPCVVSVNGVMITVAPDQKKIIEIPENKVILPRN